MNADPQDRVLHALLGGGTVPSIAAKVGLSEPMVATMVDHYARLGLLTEATSLCASGLGACHPQAAHGLTAEARVACATCPLAR